MEEEPLTIQVQDTNLEAMKAKCSAIKLGYLKDNFADCFVKEVVQKDITINRGYWSRTLAIQQTVRNFLTRRSDDDITKRQVLNLGCGYDTLYFNLNTEKDHQYVDYNFVELDLSCVIKKKIEFIQKEEKLKAAFSEPLENVNDRLLKAKNYYLGDCDLRDLEDFEQVLVNSEIDFNAPTLIFTECVQAYIEKNEIENLLKFISEKFDNVQVVDYEMFNGNDRFGKMMVKNFKERGCPLKGITFFDTLENIKNYYLNNGYTASEIIPMKRVYQQELPQAERARIEKLQWLDEFEEFFLMQEHYFISVSTKITQKDELLKDIFNNSWVGVNANKK